MISARYPLCEPCSLGKRPELPRIYRAQKTSLADLGGGVDTRGAPGHHTVLFCIRAAGMCRKGAGTCFAGAATMKKASNSKSTSTVQISYSSENVAGRQSCGLVCVAKLCEIVK